MGWDESEQRRRSVELHREGVLEAGQFTERLHLRNRRGEFADMPGGGVRDTLAKAEGQKSQRRSFMKSREDAIRGQANRAAAARSSRTPPVLGPGPGETPRALRTSKSQGPYSLSARKGTAAAPMGYGRYHAQQKALRRQGAAAGTAPQTVQSVPAPGRDRPYGGQSREQYQRERDKILTQDERRIRELEKQGLDRFGRPHTAQSVPAAPAIAPEALRSMPLYALASIIQDDWKKPYFGAVPYLQALSGLKSHDDNYGQDSGRSIVAYFLSNATTWRGPVAKAVKAELKRRTGRR